VLLPEIVDEGETTFQNPCRKQMMSTSRDMDTSGYIEV
jgi:hypothetical protein